MKAVEVKNLTKKFKEKTAVDGISFSVEEGELFALLGVNGAGKTTTIRMLSCLSVPTDGSALINGKNCVSESDSVKPLIGISPQDTSVAENLTVRENLEFTAAIYGFDKNKIKSRTAEMINAFNMSDVENSRAKTLSGGWKRKLSIAMALISEPKILFLTALTMSGLSTRRFCFEGFLPMDKKEREVVLERLQRETRTTIFYEAPHRLLKTLKVLQETAGNRRLTICKELTKRHEKTWPTCLEEAIEWYETNEPRGEYVLVLEGADAKALKEEEQAAWESLSIEEHMGIYLSKGQTKKEAMKSVASDRGMTKREVYQYLLH